MKWILRCMWVVIPTPEELVIQFTFSSDSHSVHYRLTLFSQTGFRQTSVSTNRFSIWYRLVVNVLIASGGLYSRPKRSTVTLSVTTRSWAGPCWSDFGRSPGQLFWGVLFVNQTEPGCSEFLRIWLLLVLRGPNVQALLGNVTAQTVANRNLKSIPKSGVHTCPH